jgi:hypothetical protein
MSGMSGICREYVGNVGKEEQINKKGLHLTSILAKWQHYPRRKRNTKMKITIPQEISQSRHFANMPNVIGKSRTAQCDLEAKRQRVVDNDSEI